ncbi:MAG: hypothetical protein RBT70_00875 [Alphaproteobacteria bacterium]|jgi:hypothetical protein|nr:hypothetical protein [Alphaproteobacteria bacterium]
MALRFIDGFDHYTTSSQLPYKYNIVCSSSYAALDAGRRSGSQALRVYSSSGYVAKTLGDQPTWIVGAAVKLESLPSSNGPVFAFLDGNGDSQACLCVSSTGALVLKRGSSSGTTLATSNNALLAGVWNFIEAKITVADSGGIFSACVNGQEWVTYTGDTKYSSYYAYASSIKLNGMPSIVKVWYDDFYICDGTGSVNNDFLGDVRVDTLFPSGIGNAAEFTPTGSANNWENVDDASPDEDASYNVSDTVGKKDTFSLSDLSALDSSVFGVQENILARKDDAGTRLLRGLVRVDSADHEGGDLSLGDSYGDFTQIWEKNPSTSVNWTESEVNAAEFGYKVQS